MRCNSTFRIDENHTANFSERFTITTICDPQVIVAMTVLRKDKDEPGAIGCLGQGGTGPEHRLNRRRQQLVTFYKFLNFAEKNIDISRAVQKKTQLLERLHVRLGTSPSDRRARSRSGLNCCVGSGWRSVGGSNGTPQPHSTLYSNTSSVFGPLFRYARGHQGCHPIVKCALERGRGEIQG